MKKLLKYLGSFKVILLSVIFLTIIYFLINPNKIFLNAKRFNTKFSMLENTQSHIFLKDDPIFDFLLVIKKIEEFVLD